MCLASYADKLASFGRPCPTHTGRLDDIEALNTWLDRYQSSPNTLASYKAGS